MKSTLVFLSLLGALVSIPTVQSLGQCLACPDGCSSCTWNNNQLQIVSSQRGYSIDKNNQLCYLTCTGSQYYNPGRYQCEDCPEFCSGCRLSAEGFLEITSVRTGYSIDSSSGTCYKGCDRGEYYDANQRVCVGCPVNCASCQIDFSGRLVIDNAVRGFVVDVNSATCYAPCQTGEYYNPISLFCSECPCPGSTCSYADNTLSILTLPQGYSADPFTGGCYANCPSGKYYSFNSRNCEDCPQWCTSCYMGVNGMVITSAIREYAIDTINAICYPQCLSYQYYDSNSVQCIDCPQGCTSCYQSRSFGNVIIDGYPKGWLVDTRNNICYQPCTKGFYYNPNFLTCSQCPENCVDCDYYEDGNAPVNQFGEPLVTLPDGSSRPGRGRDVVDAVDAFFDSNEFGNRNSGAFWILTPRAGFVANNFDGICYAACTDGQYYNP